MDGLRSLVPLLIQQKAKNKKELNKKDNEYTQQSGRKRKQNDQYDRMRCSM
jgi:hypothetical protein